MNLLKTYFITFNKPIVQSINIPIDMTQQMWQSEKPFFFQKFKIASLISRY